MATFNEAGWREETSWKEPIPSAGEVWSAFSDEGVNEWFRDRLTNHLNNASLLKAGLAQHRAEEGEPEDSLLTSVRELLGRAIRATTLRSLLDVTPEPAA